MANKKTIPSQSDNPSGLHFRYFIQKVVPTGSSNFFLEPEYKLKDTDPGSEYFVLRLDLNGKDPEHIKACRIGINAYADAIKDHLPDLSADLKERYPLI